MRKIFLIFGLLCLSAYAQGETGEKFIANFYNQFIFGSTPFDPKGKEMCTTQMLKFLSDKYDYDCEDENCYAIWYFRTSHQDGDSNLSEVTKVTELKDGWYKVNYIDMGTKGETGIKLVVIDNKKYIDGIKPDKTHID